VLIDFISIYAKISVFNCVRVTYIYYMFIVIIFNKKSINQIINHVFNLTCV